MTAKTLRSGHASSTLISLLQQRTDQCPEAIAYKFLLDGEHQEASITYAMLSQRVMTVAAHLQQLGLANKRALLLYQPGLDYIIGFLGCLSAGVTAVPTYPPDPFRMERTFPRFLAIANDAQPAALLMTADILDLAGDVFDEYAELRGLHRVATDSLPDDLAAAWHDPKITGAALAFLQYTSGSTAQPKGVMLTHDNLLANLAMIHQGFGMVPDDIGMIWLPPYHDMGLIGGILEPLYAGVPVILMSPLDFLQRPFRWLSAISRYGATVSGGPNFAYDLCVRKVTEAQKATLNLSSWQVAFTGAEPIRRETLERFSRAFAPCGFRPEAFYPCYGLAEGTLIVSGVRRSQGASWARFTASALSAGQAIATADDDPDGQAIVGCGTALGEEQILIMDPETQQPLPEGRVGEVWVSGPNVAVGYWNRPEESAETFAAVPRLAEGLAPSTAPAFLRTGDLGFFHGGELFIAGRIKDLIIIDGLNHYPQDIELTVEQAHPAIRPGCTAAFSITHAGEERLVVVLEIGKSYRPLPAGAVADPDQPDWLDPNAVKGAVRRAIAENHDLRTHDIVLLRPGSVPKTSSGKIQRRATRASYLAGSLDIWQ